MKHQALVPSENVAIQEISPDRLFKDMSDWSSRIAKRAYELFAAAGFTNGHDLDDWFKAEREFLKPVDLDVKDANDEFVVTAEVPGFDADDLSIHLDGSHMVIEGKHESTEPKKGKENVIYSKRKSKQIYRAIELPAAVVADRAHAVLKNGVLKLRLPKAETTKQIKVAAA